MLETKDRNPRERRLLSQDDIHPSPPPGGRDLLLTIANADRR
jgi:hypothetical protein